MQFFLFVFVATRAKNTFLCIGTHVYNLKMFLTFISITIVKIHNPMNNVKNYVSNVKKQQMLSPKE